MPSIVCEVCGKTFSKKCNLYRHIKSIHHSAKFICEICNENFNREDTLKRHKSTHNTKPAIKCEYCTKSFYNKGLLTRHTNFHHRNLQNVNVKSTESKNKSKTASQIKQIARISRKTFECNECSKKFLYRQSIVRHFRDFHTVPVTFQCENCSRSYKHKYDLIRHIRCMHLSGENLTCNNCEKNFQSKNALNKHSAKCFVRSKVSQYTPTLNCVNCNQFFPRKQLLLQHYSDQHNVVLNYENNQFNSWEIFLNWRKEVELSTITAYNLCGNKETTSHYMRRLRCHRSGKYTKKCKSNQRHKLRKKNSKKLQGFCPAEMIVKINKSDKKCFVIFQKTHVGHEIGTENELSHIFIDETKKLELIDQLASRTTLNNELQNENESAVNDDHESKKETVTKTDFQNIQCRYSLDPYSITDDPVNIPIFVQENRDSVLYFKNKNEETSITILEKRKFTFHSDDFVLIYMNAEQKKMIDLFAKKKVVAFDWIPINPVNFSLHIMMVLNYNHESLPVAFLLTNRNDEMIVTCFIECIKIQVGKLNVKTVMTDMQAIYYNAWINVMPQPQYYLHCIYHINREWKRHYQKIIQNKRGKLRIALYKLLQELDECEFKKKLDIFINQKEPYYRNFLKYFRSHYANEPKRWAYCYRPFSLINSNTHLKRNYFGEKNVKSIMACLHEMKKYISLQFLIEDMKEIDGHVPSKLALLHKRHVTTVVDLSNFAFINCDKPDTWKVILSDEVCIIRKQNPECHYNCLLKCAKCNDICLHEYTCSCIDYSIEYNMCKHIHALILKTTSSLIKTKPSISANSENACSPNTTSSEANIANKTREDCVIMVRTIENTLNNQSAWLNYKKMLQAFAAKISNPVEIENL